MKILNSFILRWPLFFIHFQSLIRYKTRQVEKKKDLCHFIVRIEPKMWLYKIHCRSCCDYEIKCRNDIWRKHLKTCVDQNHIVFRRQIWIHILENVSDHFQLSFVLIKQYKQDDNSLILTFHWWFQIWKLLSLATFTRWLKNVSFGEKETWTKFL